MTKVCVTCVEEKDLSRFGKDGLIATCKECKIEYSTKRKAYLAEVGYKTTDSLVCKRCGVDKSTSEYGKASMGTFGIRRVCRMCENEKNALTRSAMSPEDKKAIKQRYKDAHPARYYLISAEQHAHYGGYAPPDISEFELDKILKEHSGFCDCCGGINSTGKRLNIEHCHKTGKFRGLVCHRCNISIGVIEGNIFYKCLDFLNLGNLISPHSGDSVS